MKKICTVSGSEFHIFQEDLTFYEKMGVPPPTISPTERMRRRFAFRNERVLYRRTCDHTGGSILSKYHQDVPFPVFSLPVWWSDEWDGRDFGREFEFSRTFAENFKLLAETVPHYCLGNALSSLENSDYCNQVGNLKDCYLLFNADYSERCLYGKGVNRCYECVDCFKVYDCEACYEASNCNNCTFSTYLFDSQNCSECHYSGNLIGCQHCFGCVNLRNQQYHFFNERLAPEAYRAAVEKTLNSQSRRETLQRFLKFRGQHFVKWMQERNTENCSGDYLVNCKNCHFCYDCEALENSKYCSDLKRGSDVSYSLYDVSFFGVDVTECYECTTVGYRSNRLLFCAEMWPANNCYYCMSCVSNSSNNFGCFGLKKMEYCILNKQYSPDDYLKQTARIIEHMRETAEWGEFFPIPLSPHTYNESVAQEYFPLSRESALARGYRWRDDDTHQYQPATITIPDAIEAVDDSVLKAVFACEESGKNFKIQKSELEFYRKMKLPLPRLHPDQRHYERFLLRNPRELWERSCSGCAADMRTTYSPDYTGAVYCLECYLGRI